MWYKENELVQTITTTGSGADMSMELPLGRYYLLEVKSPEGYILADTPYEVELAYVDDKTPVVEVTVEASNAYLPTEVLLTKEKEVMQTSNVSDGSKSALVLKGPKSGISTRKLSLTRPLIAEIQERLQAIEENKQFFGSDYHDYGLLICYEDGRPIEPNRLERQFKQHQRDIGIPEDQQIELQGLRKSGEMHKVRLTKNNFQLVAESGGHSPEVLMSHYNEALDSEKREMYRLVERSFYNQAELEPPSEEDQATQMLEQLRQSPAMLEKLMQMVLLNSLNAQKGV